MVYEYSASAPTDGTVYVYGINLISSRDSSGNEKYYLYNAHGDVVQLVNGSGVVVKNYNYDAFGVEYDINDNDANPFRYCGEYFDKETGTIYLRARYYNPVNGRFTQQDGWEYIDINDPLSLNLYTYCENNPIRYTDPTGTTVNDVFQGAIDAIYENITGSAKKLIEKIFKTRVNNLRYNYESEYDYYLGRVVGDVLASAFGAGMTVMGIVGIIASIGTGAAITFGSGGVLTIGGVAVSVKGVAISVAATTVGVESIAFAAANFDSDYGKMQQAGKNEVRQTRPNSELKKVKDDAPSWAKHDPPRRSDKNAKEYAERILNEKYGAGNWKTGPGSEYSQIKKWAETHYKW